MIPAWQALIGSLEALHCHLVAEPFRTYSRSLSDRMSPTGSSLQQEHKWVHQQNTLERQAGRVQCTPSPLSALWITEKRLNRCPLRKLQWTCDTDAHKSKWPLYMASCEVKHINLSVRGLHYTADFSAEICFITVPSLQLLKTREFG